MLTGIFHDGSGLGNQLHRYIFTRCKALDLGVPFGMINPEKFKGTFINLDMGVKVENLLHEYHEQKLINDEGNDVRPFDEQSRFIEDFTLVDGEFQDFKYFGHHLEDIREWLKCEAVPIHKMLVQTEDICVMNFRGGEYVGVPSLFLPKSYWENAMEEMKKINPKVKFVIVTDDPVTANRLFPNFDIRHEIHADWVAIRDAHYLILSNSSFGILPAHLNTNAKKIIAPLYWAGHNKGYWQLQQNQYDKFTYI